MPRFKIKNLKPNNTIQFQSGRDWNTIERLENGKLVVKRQGDGEYEHYEVDEKAADCLITTATSTLL